MPALRCFCANRRLVNGSVEVILNPTAGSGTGRRWQVRIAELAAARLGPAAFHVTSRRGEATDLARKAVGDGAALLVVCGGDGTIQEVANGMLAAGNGRVRCELGIVNCGTGRGLADSLGLPAAIEEQLALIYEGDAVPLDVGRVRYFDMDGRRAERLFVNECQLGIGGAVVAKVERGRSATEARHGTIAYKQLGGTMAFGLVAVKELVGLRCPELSVQIDDERPVTERFVGIMVGNGAKCGGGMRLTPEARTDDGMLDVVLVREMNVVRRLWVFPRIYRGRHTGAIRRAQSTCYPPRCG
jgi:diacylglycerol kinase (ATP)